MSDDAPDPHAGSRVGDLLARERIAQKLELDEIAERTRVPIRHLIAIEKSDHAGLPAATYSAGFVKAYANLLGLDGNEMSSAFRAELGNYRHRGTDPTPFEPADPSRVPPKLLATIAAIAAILFGIAYAIFRTGLSGDDAQRLAAGTSATPPAAVARPLPASPVPSVPVAPPPPASGSVVLTALDDIWLKLVDKGGSGTPTLFMGLLRKGETYAVPPAAIDPRILTGRPEALRIMVGTRLIPPIGKPSHTVRDFSLKPDALTAFAASQPPTAAPDTASAGPAPAIPEPDAPATVEPAAAPQASSDASPSPQ